MADNRKKPAAKKKGRGGPSAALWAWIAIGIVVAVVATIVVIKTTQNTTPPPPPQSDGNPTSATIFHEVTNVPASVFDAVGVTSSISVNPPGLSTKKQPPLLYSQGGKLLPGSFYWGAEYCPYCAATRWGIIAAYSRFGSFNTLINMHSAYNDVAPRTPTFSFYWKNGLVVYTSKYIVFKTFEVVGPLNNGKTLQVTPPRELRLVTKYNKSQYFPFLDINNHVFIIGSAYDPATLAGLTREQIAGGLKDASNPVTQAIVTTANYVSAGICAATKGQPGSVCSSSGVMAAATALHLTF